MRFGLFFTIVSLGLVACASASRTGGEGGLEPVMHFRGTTTMTSTDGAVAFAPPAEVILTRSVLPERNLIVETRRSRGQTSVVELHRQGEGATFTGEDQMTGWTGTFVFTGPEWAWDHWTLELVMKDGTGRIEGTGSITPQALELERWFVTGEGTRRAKIVDRLTRISAAELERLTSGGDPAPLPGE